MKRIEHLAAISHDIGRVFQFLGIASLLPFVVLVIFQEWGMLIPLASAPLTFFVLGYLLSLTPRGPMIPPRSLSPLSLSRFHGSR
jgi:trk system potassium uptake protein TrkH